MSDLDVLGLFSAVAPQGPSRADDTALSTIGQVYGVDATARLVQVGVHGSPLWLPAMAGRYRARIGADGAPGLARVLLNPTTARPDLVLGPVNPRDPEVPGTLTAINTTTKVATVTVDGASHSVPYKAATYTVGAAVWVGLTDWGVPYLVTGPSDVAAAANDAPSAPPSPESVQVTASIGPQWSGTWRSIRSAWDRWNTGSYGGRSDLYQGDSYGSGPLMGLATYGDQLVNLGATSIDAVTVRARRNEPGAGPAALVVQGAPHGSQPAGAPTPSGSTATSAAVGFGGWTSASLPSDVREAMRTGAVKSLATVGGTYAGWGGTATPGSMVLDVTFTRPA